MAELFSRRISFVVANKKIHTMYRVNIRKEVIVQKIFQKLGTRAGVKMKEIFNQVIPELADIINLESCALFSVSRDLKHVVLEAGYPDSVGRHGIGKRFPVKSEPAFEAVLGLREFSDESPYELITPSYILVMDPQMSRLVSNSVKRFAKNHSINSILYIPLTNGEEITHFMTFDALDQKQSYSIEEIEIFLFLVRELVKAQRMEVLDDILHDFKNPAIATAGFARRLKQLLQKDDDFKTNKKITTYLNILLEETSRMQEMAMSLSQVGQERILNLTSVLKSRFEINKEAIKEQLKQNVTLREGPFEDPLKVKCYRLQLERAIDNLLNNATNAIPVQGGILSIRTFAEGEWACAEITNTGVIPEDERMRFLEGEGRGRGLYITHRILQIFNGKMEIIPGKDTTGVLVRLPLWKED
jgi:signal transduction histidine kinase